MTASNIPLTRDLARKVLATVDAGGDGWSLVDVHKAMEGARRVEDDLDSTHV